MCSHYAKENGRKYWQGNAGHSNPFHRGPNSFLGKVQKPDQKGESFHMVSVKSETSHYEVIPLKGHPEEAGPRIR